MSKSRVIAVIASMVSLTTLGQESALADDVPRLVCAGGPATSEPENFSFRGQASCSNSGSPSTAGSWVTSSWTTNPQEVLNAAECRHNPLNGTGVVGVARGCVGLADGTARLFAQIRAKALAGFQNRGSCDGGDYCGASASVLGAADTSFSVDVTQVNRWCIAIISFVGNESAERGYSTSHWFKPYAKSVTDMLLISPGNQSLAIVTQAAYLLDTVGTWRIRTPMSVSHHSNMAENSAQITRTQSLVLRMLPANADRTCPKGGTLSADLLQRLEGRMREVGP
jgi:hypothetical protein